MADVPETIDDVAALMRVSLPEDVSPSEFGRKMNWGRGSDEARARMETITRQELEEIGLDDQHVTNWAIAYEAVMRLMPDNPSAAGRAELLRHAAKLLQGE